jgi:hypothetical protein
MAGGPRVPSVGAVMHPRGKDSQMRQRPTARLTAVLTTALTTALTAAATGFVVLATAQPAAAGGPETIVSIATAEYNNESHNHTDGPNCNFYTGALGVSQAPVCNDQGWRAEAWCADFARWVWKRAGVQQTGQLNALAESFRGYGNANHTWHTGSPKIGDAVTFEWGDGSSDVDHVGIVTGVSSSQITYISGNDGNDEVGRKTISRSSATIIGYVTPLFPAVVAAPVARVSPLLQYGSQLQTMGVADNLQVYDKVFTPGQSWSEWRNQGGNIIADPVSVQYGDQLEVAGIAPDGSVIHKNYTPNVGWSPWYNLGPADFRLNSVTVGVYNNQLVMFGIAWNGAVWNRTYTPGTGWTPRWNSMGGVLTGNLAVVQYGTQLEVVGVAPDGSVWGNVYTPGHTWSGWTDLGGTIISNPAVTVYNSQLEVFGVAPDHTVWNRVYTPGHSWSAWTNFGGSMNGNLATVQYKTQLEVVGRWSDGSVRIKTFTPGQSWTDWVTLDGKIINDPGMAVYNDQLSIIGRGPTGGNTYIKTYTPGHSWSGWNNLLGNLEP